MRQSSLIFIFFLSVPLVWPSSSLRAQTNSTLGKKELAAKWETAHPRFLKGRDHFIRKEYDRAEAELQKCLEVFPDHPDALFYLAQLEYRRHDFVRALADIEKAETGHGQFAGVDSPVESLRRTSLLDERKRMEQEIAFMEEILYDPSCKTDNEMLKLPESIEVLRREIQAINAQLSTPSPIGPKLLPADYSYVHGNILFKLNRTRGAAEQYLKAIASDSRHAGAYNNLINLLYMAREYRRAMGFIVQAEANGVDLNKKLKQAVIQLAKK